MTKYYSINPPPGKTRKCLDAWGKCFIKSNGDVWLCCNGAQVGNINSDDLKIILNNDRSQAYRKGLLEGELLPACRECIDKPICSVDELKDVVRDFYEKGTFLY